LKGLIVRRVSFPTVASVRHARPSFAEVTQAYYSNRGRLVLPAVAVTILYGYAVLASFPLVVGALVLLIPVPFVAIGVASIGMAKTKRQIVFAVGLAAIFLYGYAFLHYFSAPLGSIAWLAQLPVMLAYLAIAWLAGKLPKSSP
jgi:hypothetical protein